LVWWLLLLLFCWLNLLLALVRLAPVWLLIGAQVEVERFALLSRKWEEVLQLGVCVRRVFAEVGRRRTGRPGNEQLPVRLRLDWPACKVGEHVACWPVVVVVVVV